MNSSINKFKKCYDLSNRYINYLKSENLLITEGDISPFWQTLFQERANNNYPTFTEILNMRRGYTYGLADQLSNIDLNEEYQYAKAAYSDVSRTVPKSYFKKYSDSIIGNPVYFDFGGLFYSGGYLANALTAYHIRKWCQTKGLSKRPLKILEIGAGYGNVAYQLLNSLNIEQYTICDLPENLFLSSYYLQANFPDKSSVFVTKNKSTVKQSTDFKFLTPVFLEKITEKFDLVINSFSFQEMNLESVNKYFCYIKDHLADDGIFYSLNSHGKSGVVNPSDYPIEHFKLLSMAIVRHAPWQDIFATTPYELVMGKKISDDSDNDKQSVKLIFQFDTLAKAFQLGLQDELINLCIKFVNSKLSKKEAKWLRILNTFFLNSNYHEKNKLLKTMSQLKILSGVVLYLFGCLEFSYENINQSELYLKRAIIKVPNTQAKLRSFLILANINFLNCNLNEANYYLQKAISISPHLKKNLYQLSKHHSNLVANISKLIYLDSPKLLSWRNTRKFIYNTSLIVITYLRNIYEKDN